MNDRFSPAWRNIEPCLNRLLNELEGSEHLFVNAFLSVSRPQSKPQNAAEVRSLLHGISIAPGIPWVLFDTISALVRSLPAPMRNSLIKSISIATGRTHERLQIALDGRWQVAWQISQAAEPEYRYVGLDWYVPIERDKAPVVPLQIIDYIAGSISLLRDNLVLPSAAALLIALEAVLWDDLTARGIERSNDKVTYSPVIWEFKIVKDKLVISIDGADKKLEDFRKDVGFPKSQGKMVLRKLRNETNRTVLRIDIDQILIEYLASDKEESRESSPEKGLAEAIQRARASDILKTIPIQLDETLYRLRNTLIHLPSEEDLNVQIPVPESEPIRSLLDLRSNPQFITELIFIVVNLINSLYATRNSGTY